MYVCIYMLLQSGIWADQPCCGQPQIRCRKHLICALSSKSLMYKGKKKTDSSQIIWQGYVKRTMIWLCSSSSRCKDLRGQTLRVSTVNIGHNAHEQGDALLSRPGNTRSQCVETQAIGWKWHQDGKLKTTKQESKTPLESRRRTYCIFAYSCSILWCI